MKKELYKKSTHLFFCLFFLLISIIFFKQTALSEEVRGVTDTTIKVGMIAGMTGPSASVTAILGDVARDCTRYINDQGGIHGRKVETLIEDDRYSIPMGISAFKKLIFKDKVFALSGPYTTPSMKALYGKMEKYKIPNPAAIPQPNMINPLKKYVFATGEFYDDDFGVIFDYIINELKSRDMKLAYITYDGESGKEVHTSIKKWAQFFHYEHPIPKEIIPLGALEASSQVMSIKRQGITHILIHHMVANTALLLRELRKFGLNTPVYADLLSCSEDTIKLAGEASRNYISAIGFSSWYDDTPGMKKVREIALKYHPGTDKPWRSKYYTAGWIVMTLLFEGMKRAGRDLTPDSFVQALETLKNFDTEGLCGPITFSPTDHKGFSSCKLFKSDPSTGKLVPITDWRNPPKSQE
ncbi:MAG: ABC transporter substrate-binding protein [Thermodesulfobacteriota bacterium]|nr:ABC transporter substrate-binding protein [Thermodesulfobacteriota bacterium]